jgi:hypothetical protein
MGKSEATNMMDMPSHVRSHILKFLWSEEYDAWEYNENDRISIFELYKLLAPVTDDDEKQMSDILAHVHLGVVDHLVIHAYLESCTRDRYDGRPSSYLLMLIKNMVANLLENKSEIHYLNLYAIS